MKKLYVIVRKDLTFSQQAVQGGHAIAQYLIDNPNTEWNNGTLVLLGVKGEFQLKKWTDRLESHGLKLSSFREPDIGDQLTAISVVSSHEDYFKRLVLV